MAPSRKVVLFANNKGGVGKSTLSSNVAAMLARELQEGRVLYVDLTFTKSISTLLLGESAPRTFNKLIQDFNKTSRVRQQFVWSIFLWFGITACSIRFSGAELGATLACAYVLFAYFTIRRAWFTRVDPVAYASKSTLSDNLHVLVGGESLASSANTSFPWKTAAREWKVAEDVRVIIDIDNTLDDHARFALQVCTDVVVPLTLNPMDFDRLCVDPRNQSLIEFVTKCSCRRKLRHVILNRLKCTSNTRGEEDKRFGVSAADQAQVTAITQRFDRMQLTNLQLTFMRELPPSILYAMHEVHKPIAYLDVATKIVPTAQMDAALDDLRIITESIFS